MGYYQDIMTTGARREGGHLQFKRTVSGEITW